MAAAPAQQVFFLAGHRNENSKSRPATILSMPDFDVVGIGLSSTDTLIVVPHFPAYAGKTAIEEEIVSPGGQMAGAMVTCARLGLRVKYISAIGGDECGSFCRDEPQAKLLLRHRAEQVIGQYGQLLEWRTAITDNKT